MENVDVDVWQQEDSEGEDFDPGDDDDDEEDDDEEDEELEGAADEGNYLIQLRLFL